MTFEPRAAWIARIKSRRAERSTLPGNTDSGAPEIGGVLVGSAVSTDIVRTPLQTKKPAPTGDDAGRPYGVSIRPWSYGGRSRNTASSTWDSTGFVRC